MDAIETLKFWLPSLFIYFGVLLTIFVAVPFTPFLVYAFFWTLFYVGGLYGLKFKWIN